MDLIDAIVAQIQVSDHENKIKEGEVQQKKLEDAIRAAYEQRVRARDEEIKFAIQKEKLENSPLREIMETLAQQLNSPNQPKKEIAILKAKIVAMVRDNSHNKIGEAPVFSVSEPCCYSGYYGEYHIHFYVDYLNERVDTIFDVSYSEETSRFRFLMNLYQHNKHLDFTSDDQVSMAKEITSFLMTK